MRQLIALLMTCSFAHAATYVLCSSMSTLADGTACTHTSFKTLVETVMQPGDTVILKSGDENVVGSTTTIPAIKGKGWRKFRAENYVRNFRPGYRTNPTTDAANYGILRMNNAVVIQTAPQSQSWSAIDVDTDTITITGHGFAEADQVSVGFQRRSPLFCADNDTPNYDAATPTYDFPCTGRGDYVFDRFPISGDPVPLLDVVENQPVRVYGKFTSNLTHGGTYYVKNLGGADAGYCTNCTWQLSATPGGAAINFTDDVEFVAMVMETPPYPLQSNTTYYVKYVDANNFQLALTAGGASIDIINSPTDGGSVSRIEAVENIIFEGIEFRVDPSAGSVTYPGGLLGQSVGHIESVPRNIHYRHTYFHGNFAQYGPNQGIGFNVKDSSISDSHCDEVKSNSDSQCIFILNSPGNLVFRNNHLNALGENIMAGGSTPSIRELTPRKLLFERNYFPKHLYMNYGFNYTESGLTNGFRIASQLPPSSDGTSTTNCGTAYTQAGPSAQCYAYTRDETRCVLTTDQAFTTLSGSGTIAIGVMPDCTFIAKYTNGVTLGDGCPSEFSCEDTGASIVWPSDGIRHYNVTVASGNPTKDDTNLVQYLVSKNSFEAKLGQEWTAVGNVFRSKWVDPGGQWQGITLHPQIGSNVGETFSWWTDVRNMVFKFNQFEDITQMVSTQQSTFLNSDRREANVSGFGGGNAFEHNIGYGINAYQNGKYGGSTWATGYQASNVVFRLSSPGNVARHNTLVDAEVLSIYMHNNAANYNIVTDNIFVPLRRTSNTPVFPAAISQLSLTYCAMLSEGVNVNGVFSRNIIMNVNSAASANDDVGTCGDAGVDYPTNTWLLNGANDVPGTLFTGWARAACGPDATSECATRASLNLRLADTTYKAGGANEATDGTDLGADIDQVEAYTGKLGVGVKTGIPPFSRRSGRRVVPSTTSASLIYLPSTGGCDIKIWSSSKFIGTPVFDDDDSGGSLSNRFLTLSIPGLSSGTKYYGKRWCGDEVDVFRFKTL